MKKHKYLQALLLLLGLAGISSFDVHAKQSASPSIAEESVCCSDKSIAWTHDPHLLAAMIRTKGYEKTLAAIVAATHPTSEALDTEPLAKGKSVPFFQKNRDSELSWWGPRAWISFIKSSNADTWHSSATEVFDQGIFTPGPTKDIAALKLNSNAGKIGVDDLSSKQASTSLNSVWNAATQVNNIDVIEKNIIYTVWSFNKLSAVPIPASYIMMGSGIVLLLSRKTLQHRF